MPDTPEVVAAFGVHGGNRAAVACPLAVGSVFYDVHHQLIIDAALLPAHSPEREAAQGHLERSQPNDLILYDRGYGAFWFYALHRRLQRAFCIRSTPRHGDQFASVGASRRPTSGSSTGWRSRTGQGDHCSAWNRASTPRSWPPICVRSYASPPRCR
ncbi:MAG: hypothetical protein ACPGUC_11015 [Gammaproteobacteria bacterium]